MPNIKINYIDGTGVRTSTTINGEILRFYCVHVLGRDTCVPAVMREDLYRFMDGKSLHSKQQIERALLQAIYAG